MDLKKGRAEAGMLMRGDCRSLSKKLCCLFEEGGGGCTEVDKLGMCVGIESTGPANGFEMQHWEIEIRDDF